jgi:hypothetical protein
METRIFEMAQEGIWIWALFLFGVVGCYLLLAQKHSAALASAIFRTIGSIITSPFNYLEKTIAELALGDNNPRLLNIDHYLLRRLLTALQVGLLLSVILGAGMAMASAVLEFLPSHDLRERSAEAQHSLRLTENSLEEDSAKLKSEDSDWQNQRPTLIKQAQDAERQKKADVQASLRSDEANIKAPEAIQVLNTVRNFFATHAGEYGAIEQATAFVNRIPSLSESDTRGLIAYCHDWERLQSLSSQAPKTTEQVRAEVQPDRDNLVQKVADETSQVQGLSDSVKALQEQVREGYNQSGFVLTLFFFFFAFLAYVWVVGTSIEAFSMAIYLSNDVKQIRAQGENTAAYR